MIGRLIEAIDRLNATTDGTSPSKARVQLILTIGFAGGALIHAVWVPMFFHLDLPVLAYWNVIVTPFFVVAALLVRNPVWIPPTLYTLATVEMPGHGLLATYYTGTGTLFWMFPVTVSVLICAAVFLSWARRLTISLTILTLTAGVGAWITFTGPATPLTTEWQTFFFATNCFFGAGQLILLFALFQRAVRSAERSLVREFNRAEDLLHNILPDPIALRLKDGEKVIADEHEDVSVVFADIVDFTEASARLSPAELVQTLNTVFSEFDKIAAAHGAEKIKTIGDAYMVVVGVPDAQQSHAEVAVRMADEMLKAAHRVSADTHFPVKMRVGVNSGPVVAGVIGTSKFAYDLWGDAVNVASRMEAHAEPGKVYLTEATRTHLSDDVAVHPEGTREVKGKGAMQVYSLVSVAVAAE